MYPGGLGGGGWGEPIKAFIGSPKAAQSSLVHVGTASTSTFHCPAAVTWDEGVVSLVRCDQAKCLKAGLLVCSWCYGLGVLVGAVFRVGDF